MNDDVDDLQYLHQTIRAVVAEVRHELRSDRWALIPNERMVALAHAAAGLSHVCVLAEDLVASQERGSELISRMLTRALFETWLTAYYIALEGIEALERVMAAHVDAINKQAEGARSHDERLAKRRSEVFESNRRIESQNANIQARNARYAADAQVPLRELETAAVGVPTQLDPGELQFDWAVDPRRLGIRELVDLVGAATREAGHEETFEAAYHLAYRSLSNYGAHPSLFVLDSYIEHGTGHFIRIRDEAHVNGSFDIPNAQLALLLTSGLSVEVLEARGAACTVAYEAANFLNQAFG